MPPRKPPHFQDFKRNFSLLWLQDNVIIMRVIKCVLCCFCRVRLLVIPWTVAHQAPLSMKFSRQEYIWSAIPPPGDLPSPGIKPTSLMSPALAGGFFTSCHLEKCHLGSPCSIITYNQLAWLWWRETEWFYLHTSPILYSNSFLGVFFPRFFFLPMKYHHSSQLFLIENSFRTFPLSILVTITLKFLFGQSHLKTCFPELDILL